MCRHKGKGLMSTGGQELLIGLLSRLIDAELT